MTLQLDLRSASLVMDSTGHQQWREADSPTTLQASATALLLCDVWNDHTSRGAVPGSSTTILLSPSPPTKQRHFWNFILAFCKP